ncbi:MAG: hypothetical protein MUC87_01880 [Bacteroidia bacterium]|jgi:hypothetical protein|nr:hypothetical protein [Bacteroidia bacterium]
MQSQSQKRSKTTNQEAIPEEVLRSVISHLQDKLDARRKEKEMFTASMKKITGGKGFTLTFSK